MNIKVVSQSACFTNYRIDDEAVQLWIISGGTPCIDFIPTYGFSQRYPVVEKWNRWMGNHYAHQDPAHIVGPRAEEVLPNGRTDLEQWYTINKPLKDLRDFRYNQLYKLMGGTQIESRKIRDRDEGCFFRATWMLYNHNCVCTVQCESKYGNGHSLDLAPAPWKELSAALLEGHDLWETWYGMSEERFQKIFNALANVMQTVSVKTS